MARFKGKAEKDAYRTEYCGRCVHDDDGGCPVWLFVSESRIPAGSKHQRFSDTVIPNLDGTNQSCRMYHFVGFEKPEIITEVSSDIWHGGARPNRKRKTERNENDR